MSREHISGVDMYTQAEIIEMKNKIARFEDRNKKLEHQLDEYKKIDEKYGKLKDEPLLFFDKNKTITFKFEDEKRGKLKKIFQIE